MSVVPYPEYKDSGVEWIGTIPRTWGILPIKRIARLCTDRADEQSFPVALENIQSWTGAFTESDATYEGEGVSFRLNDILFGKLRPYLAKVWLADRQGEAIGDFHVIRCFERCYPDFLKRVLLTREIISLIDGSTHGAKMPRAGWDFMGSIQIPLPTLEEQATIAAFLDQETGMIDALVAEQERLIALLKEKRQAVISQAVTKGLNPNAPMKDSGIEWLGQVPAHWKIYQLKRTFRSVDYGISDALALEGSIIVLRMNNIQNGAVSLEDVKYTENVDQDLILEPGDLLYNRTNSLDLIGKVGVYEEKSENPVSFASYLVRFRLREGLPKYFSFLLNTNNLLGLVRSSAYVAIGQCNLNPTKYGEIVVAIPPPDEQAYITHFLNAQVKAIDTLITEATQAITLLRERRAALISAAVTGKIDVRSLTPTKQEAA